MRQVLLFPVLVALCCGASLQHEEADERIVGGTKAKIEDYPYQIAIEVRDIFVCGAALIKPNIVVTAAHCTDVIKSYLGQIMVRAGSSIKKKGGEVVKVSRICQHPRYVPDLYEDYDVAVLKLERNVKLNNAVRAIELQGKGMEVPDGTMGTATGWGKTATAEGSDDLLKVDVPKINHSDCKKTYRQLTERMDCYGYKQGGKDACSGDSGGPLAVNGKLAGIISWGEECAKPLNPGVYTKISNSDIHDFITKCIQQFP